VAWQTRFRCLCGGVALLGGALFAGAHRLLASRVADPAVRADAQLALLVVAAAALAALAGTALACHRFVLLPLEHLEREVRIVSRVNPAHEIELPRGHLLGAIPQVVNELGASLWRAQREIAAAVSATAGGLEHDKARLEDILQSLQEGLVVCDDRARVLFYNAAARRVFQDSVALGLGRSLTLLCAAAPLENALALLRQRAVRHPEEHPAEQDVSFVCSTVQETILGCRMRLLPPVPGMAWCFVLTCEDISRDVDGRGRREDTLRARVKQMRGPLTNLALGVESLKLLDDPARGSRAALEEALVDDARRLVEHFGVLAGEVESLDSPRYLIRDVLTEDLLALAAQRLAARGLRLTLIGDPLWVKADVLALLSLVEFFAGRIHDFCGADALEVETLLGDRRVHFTFTWPGPVIPETEIRGWMSTVLAPPGAHTLAEVLERHGSEVWSMPHAEPGFSTLRLPLPASPEQWTAPRPPLPSRPVYVDFAAREEPGGRERADHLRLDQLSFVVFDTETTGLAPLAGDEIVSLAGVKVVSHGIVVGETFNQIVDPRRDIPPSSVRFHGITDEMARGQPPIEEALRAFHAFVGDAVLVGHNAEFDLRFIRMKERAAGVHFPGPALDTLAISRYLHGHTPEHSLDAVARRLGVGIRERHTAYGDALITAQVFLKFLYLLQERGIVTLGRLREVTAR
jgi:DNA polymerase-3 subunit epsilon